MALHELTPTSGGGDYTPAPEGSQPATVIALIDLGTQSRAYAGETRTTPEVYVIFELAAKDPKGQPFLIGERYTYSFHVKSKFRTMVEALTGKRYKDDERFPPRDLLGRKALVSVLHEAGSRGEYAKFNGVVSLPAGLSCPEPVRTLLFWEIENGTLTDLAGLPYCYGKKLEAVVAAAPEWGKRNGHAVPSANGSTTAAKPAAVAAPMAVAAPVAGVAPVTNGAKVVKESRFRYMHGEKEQIGTRHDVQSWIGTCKLDPETTKIAPEGTETWLAASLFGFSADVVY
jgi:hypothetical protein